MIKQHKIVFGNQSTYCSGSPGFVFVQSQYNREPHGAQRRRQPRPRRAAAVSMGSGGVCGGGSLSSFSSDALQNAANNVEPRTRCGLLSEVSADASFQLLQGEIKEAGRTWREPFYSNETQLPWLSLIYSSSKQSLSGSRADEPLKNIYIISPASKYLVKD